MGLTQSPAEYLSIRCDVGFRKKFRKVWPPTAGMRFVACAVLSFALSGCQSGMEPAPDEGLDQASRTAKEEITATSPAAHVEGLVTSLSDLESATIRIRTLGSFVDPNEGRIPDTGYSGSGFLIDSSGIAVTNNHVVAGAALIEVFVNEETVPRNARLLGHSECSDIALIEIRGDGHAFLDWSTQETYDGEPVTAAGFPDDSESLVVTQGLVSTYMDPHAGEMSWASLAHQIRHDAPIGPGSSGGPLLNAALQVVGVNYAGQEASDMSYAIGTQQVVPMLERLVGGEDIDSIGLNGIAYYHPDLDLTGIWAVSVESGSPADQVGIEPGDIVTKLENVTLASDRTMSVYCDILRSHKPTDVLQIEVLRGNSKQILEGRLNGSPLEATFSLADPPSTSAADPTARRDVPSVGYVEIVDELGVFSVHVPDRWTDLDLSPSRQGPRVVAATSARDYLDDWTSSGVMVGVTTDWAHLEFYDILDRLLPEFKEGCRVNPYAKYVDVFYDAAYATANCGDLSEVGAVVAKLKIGEQEMVMYAVVHDHAADQMMYILDNVLKSFAQLADS